MDYTFDLPSTVSNSPMINYRKDAKKGVKFSFMVAGELGTGKTTFVNCLLNRNALSHTYAGATNADTKTLAFTLAHSMALPNTSILARNVFDAALAHEEPGIALTETKVELLDEEGVRIHLNIIDTPGFGENFNNEMCFAEIENYLKQQFDLVLAEETRIRRNPRFVDTRVHVLIYFITPTGHGLRDLDVTCMKRLSKYVNIIPVIGRADSFLPQELEHFKEQIRIDIERFNVPVFQFDSFLNEYDEAEDYDLIQECKYLTLKQPFAIVASETDYEVQDASGSTKTVRARKYPWGLVDVNNPKYSDFAVLRLVLLGLHLQDLKDLTHDFLYESYRTERLTKVTGKPDDEDEFHDLSEQPGMHNTVPSLSNLAQLTEDTVAKDDASMVSSGLRQPLFIEERNLTFSLPDSDTKSFKRLLIAPQRTQLRQILETVPYVIRHERILERQQKLEEMEMALAKELASRAAMLEQKAAALKAQERRLMEQMERKTLSKDETVTDLHLIVSRKDST